MILRAAISIYLVVVFVSLCSKPSYTPRNQFGVTQQLGCPVAGIAMRQGRRFAMEDRVVLATAELSANPICGGASYTFAAGECFGKHVSTSLRSLHRLRTLLS